MATNGPVTLETPIVVKIQFQGSNRRFKVPLRDLGATVFPDKLRHLLQIPRSQEVIFERYSDSAGAYVTLDANKPQVYKSLFRAAKAKLKLKLRASFPEEIFKAAPVTFTTNLPNMSLHRMSGDTLSPPRAEPVVISPLIAHTPSHHEMPPLEPVAQTSPVSPLATNTADADIHGEAPVPRAFAAEHPLASRRSLFFSSPLAKLEADLAFRPKRETVQTSWVVYCNNCNSAMEDEHYHCSICDNGDYDLCPSCVDSGVHCPGSGHWMVKRFVKNGSVVNSTTERVEVKKPETEPEVPGAFTEEKQSVAEVVEKEAEEPTRTCNCCVQVLHECEFVTCASCEDYDLCMQCHIDNKHGHHPGHAFRAATEQTNMPALADFLCNAGRNVRHSAVCDGCEKFIYGVRHKCLICPDWDFCSECIKSAKFIHPAHRFVPIYEPLAEPVSSGDRHYGIYCDGPLCKDKQNMSYIEGIRYKCAVCHDTDFCANCEAHPSNRHNHTHPLIKFKRPVRSVSVTTLNEDKNGMSVTRVGDREPVQRSTSTETLPASPTNTAAQVHTIAFVKPSEDSIKTTKDKIEIRDLLAEPVQETKAVKTEPVADELDAHFVRDAIPDGSKISAGFQFVQIWTLRNPGPNAWPAGCSVRHVGGDNMLDLDNSRVLSQCELAEASETNVIGRPVAVGEEVAFRIVLKAPVREGTAISYWRLKTANGTPFGHRLWCDIQVTAPPVPASPLANTIAEVEASSSEPAPTTSLFENYLTQQTQKEVLERLNRVQVEIGEKQQKSCALAKLEQERMLRIQKVRKAAVERLMEVRRKEQEYNNVLARALEVSKDSKIETAELPAEKEVEETKSVEAPQQSGMIFPQLEKESPESSTHEAVAAPESPRAASVTTATATDEEFFEDAESVEIISDDEDGSFMTDEEYDILESADEGFP